MRKLILPITSGAILVTGLAMSVGSSVRGTKVHQTFPPDPEMIYPISQADFNNWFVSGMPAFNGAVKPANSITLDTNNPNSSFYFWSYQMFLWLTSPGTGPYAGGRVFLSPVFYDVSPIVKGQRTLTRFSGHPLNLAVRINEPGPDGLTMAHDKAGHAFEVERARVSAAGRPMLKNAAGKLVEVARVVFKAGSAKPTFLDPKGAPISNAKPMLRTQSGKVPILQRLVVKGRRIFIDSTGTPINVSPDQADGGVQLTQKGDIMYYSIGVNDVYAYFLTKNYPQSPTTTLQFPMTASDVASIQAYALQHGGPTFPDPEALAIEVKSAWVEASKLSNPGSYIQTMGYIPTYTKTSSTTWTPTGKTKLVPLALMGMHVVGSTKGHPEMVWASFEHYGNTPNDAYQYIPAGGTTPVTVGPDTMGKWVFAPGTPVNNYNLPMAVPAPPPSADIVANANLSSQPPIGPSNAIRFKPFGAAWDGQPTNPFAASAAISNTQVLSINKTVGTKMPPGDLRDRYFFIGSTWTENGAAPTNPYPGPPPGNTGGNEVGTGQMTNSTMETFMETSVAHGGTGSGYANSGCFACHKSNTVSVSHIFLKTKPLF